MSITVNGTNGLTFNDASTQNTAATGFGFKNRIINGDMRIDQRNAGAGVAIPVTANFYVDRFLVYQNNASVTGTIQRTTTAPVGFSNSLAISITTGSTAGSTTRAQIQHAIEGLNFSDLGWGTADALPVTLSFWVRSSKTGQLGGAVQNSASNRSYPYAYTINLANTWEYKTVTIPGETTGTWATDNTAGLGLVFDLGSGSALVGAAGAWAVADYRGTTGDTSIVATSGATFYITGVQLEKGSTATSFDYRPYGAELALCQRYLPAVTSAVGYGYSINTTTAVFGLALPNTARVSPSGLTVTPSSFTIFNGSNAPTIPSAVAFNSAGLQTADVVITTTGLTAGQGIRANGGTLLFTGCEL